MNPFLKWVGGKRWLVDEICARLPDNIVTYFEPFVGGGSVFFALAARRRFSLAVLGDLNGDLVNAYNVVRDSPFHLITALGKLAPFLKSEDDYYRLRNWCPDTDLQRAARMIYLNRSCFNGLWRVNRKGEFNVPFGRYTNPQMPPDDVIKACSEALQGVEILRSSFERTVESAVKGDAVYFDPPYLADSASGSVVTYSETKYTAHDDARLDVVIRELKSRGVAVVASTSSTSSLSLTPTKVRRPGTMNSDPKKRKRVEEVLWS